MTGSHPSTRREHLLPTGVPSPKLAGVGASRGDLSLLSWHGIGWQGQLRGALRRQGATGASYIVERSVAGCHRSRTMKGRQGHPNEYPHLVGRRRRVSGRSFVAERTT